MNNLGTVTLETERLILRKVTVDDCEVAFKNWTSDPLVSRYVTWDTHENVGVTKELFTIWENDYNLDHKYRWVVYVKELDTIIGTIDVVHQSIKEKTCEIGYCYGSKFWGHGYATEALKKVMDFLFNEVGFYLIEARHLVNNPASGRVMEKAGMKYEATLRDRFVDKETLGRASVKVYSKIKDIN